MTTIGSRTRNIEWQDRTVGAVAYTGDVSLPGTLVARIVRSPLSHARIRSIDASAAERAPGVVAVITAEDLGDVRFVHHGGPLSDRHPLARDTVRFVGQEVAAVAAETAEEADAAVRLIRVDYRPLPAATTLEEAMHRGAIAIHPNGNRAMHIERRYGNARKGRERATTMVSGRYRFGRQTHVCMETNSTLARWDPEREVMDLWTSTQAPYFIRKEVAHALGLDIEQVKTHEVAVGGGFGSKSKISEHEVICAALARKARRPVRLILDRMEEFTTTKCRHDWDVQLETGADEEGHVTHRAARILVDNGAYNHSGPSVMGFGTLVMGSLYRTEGVDIDADLVYTNKHPGGQFRGYGGPQATFAIESQMDELAEALDLDPIDLRIRNANRTGDVTHTGWKLSSARLVDCLKAVREAIGWDEKRTQGGSGRGVGVAVAMHVTGAHVYEGAEVSHAGVDVSADGTVRVRFGGADAGTGQKTILAQVAAQELGVELDRVKVLTTETDETPPDLGAWSSRGTFMSGHAVRAAAASAAGRLKEAAAEKLGVDAGEVELAGGQARVGDDHLDLGDLVPLAAPGSGELSVEEAYTATMEPVNPATGVANLSPAYSFCAQAVEVEVDRRTGEVRVLDFVAAHDSGTIINPIAAGSQVIGGVAMGLGAALGEELIYEEGRAVNPAYISYALPRAADLPSIRPIFIEHEDPVGPYGAKGLGEISLVPTQAAVANAVAHAIGVRVRELPITPDKVIRGLRELRQDRPRRYHLWRRPSRWEIGLIRWLYPRGLHSLLHRWGTRFARTPEPREIEEIRSPEGMEEATSVLRKRSEASPIGGGTDLLTARRQGLANPVQLVDLTTVRGLDVVEETGEGDLRVGAAVTLADLSRHPLIEHDDLLRETVGRIASPQIREMATVGGNLCQQKRCWFYRNGFLCYKRGGVTCPCYAVMGDHRFYHAVTGAHRCQAVTPSDLATTLLALDADVVLAGDGAPRVLPIDRFFVGPGETALERGEILSEVRVPATARRRVGRFEKLRLWEGDFAVASVAASLTLGEDGAVRDARVVLGAVAPTPLRAHAVERALLGRRLETGTIEAAAEAWTEGAHPLPGNEWKIDATVGLTQRCLERCGEAFGTTE